MTVLICPQAFIWELTRQQQQRGRQESKGLMSRTSAMPERKNPGICKPFCETQRQPNFAVSTIQLICHANSDKRPQHGGPSWLTSSQVRGQTRIVSETSGTHPFNRKIRT